MENLPKWGGLQLPLLRIRAISLRRLLIHYVGFVLQSVPEPQLEPRCLKLCRTLPALGYMNYIP